MFNKVYTSTYLPISHYSVPYRLAVYELLSLNIHVSLDKIPRAMQGCIWHLTRKHLQPVPTRQTIARMSDELGIISCIQVGSLMHQHENLTVGWDGSPIAGDHINVSIGVGAKSQASRSHSWRYGIL